MANNRDWIAYIGPFPFPWGQPGSRRVCGIARSLASGGQNIVVADGGHEPRKVTSLNEGETPDSIMYIGLSEMPFPNSSLTEKAIQIFIRCGKKTVDWLDTQPIKPSHVILYGGNATYMLRLHSWCRKNKVPLIADVVEWYKGSHMNGGFFGPFHISAKIALHFQFQKCSGIIAISSYLEKYFKNKGCLTIRIPPTLDVKAIAIDQYYKNKKSKLTLVYAGAPGKKDLIKNVIQGILEIDPTGKNICLLVLGPSIEQLKMVIKRAVIPSNVKVFGKIEQMDIAAFIKQSDFSVLLREPLRFAQAGFPTKVVESMANGTPVIANLTGDLGMYLHDGAEGLICRDYSAEAFSETLERALQLSFKQRLEMRRNARLQAERSFDFRNYSEALARFINKLKI